MAIETSTLVSKTTPVDDDFVPLIDTVDTATMKKLTWANIKSALFNLLTNGAASLPAFHIRGVPFAGTGTTSFPLVYINDANATASTTLNTAGTYFGVNGDGTQDLMNLMKDGVSQYNVNSIGGITSADAITSMVNTSGYSFTGGVTTYEKFTVEHGAGKTCHVRIPEIGTLSFTLGYAKATKDTALSRLSAGVIAIGTGAWGNTSGSLSLTNITASGTIKLGSYTVATLPTPETGMRCHVTDASAPSYGVTVSGGGAVTIPVFYNGADWICA